VEEEENAEVAEVAEKNAAKIQVIRGIISYIIIKK
jgi:hypothetical protein